MCGLIPKLLQYERLRLGGGGGDGILQCKAVCKVPVSPEVSAINFSIPRRILPAIFTVVF